MARRRSFRRCHGARFLVAAIAVAILSSLVWTVLGRGFDPYKILGVSRTSSSSEIKKGYRKLCLQYHPDKNVNKSEKERELAEKKFKEVQAAYDMIENGAPPPPGYTQGGPSSRSSYRNARYNPYARSNPYRSEAEDAFAFVFEEFTKSFANRAGQRSSMYRTRSRFGPRRPFGMRNDPNAYSGNEFPSFLQREKSIYLQRVKIPLEVLYKGDPSFRFRLKDNLIERYRASFRGKMFAWSLYQAFGYSLPILPRSRILALIVGLCVIHATTPTPDPDTSYVKAIPRGAKGGETSVRFDDQKFVEINFEIEEGEHPVYRREGDNLHAELTLTSQEAKKGCTKRLEALDPDEKSIEIRIPANQFSFKKQQEHQKRQKQRGQHKRGFSLFSYDNTIKVGGRGWPIRKTQYSSDYRHGDLIVTVRVLKPSSRKR